MAGTAALQNDGAERSEAMEFFREKVVLLTDGLNEISGFRSLPPAELSEAAARVLLRPPATYKHLSCI